MEEYTGVKFRCVRQGDTFAWDQRLRALNSWVFVLACLGLTPVHTEGAYGNQSYRTDGTSLIITRSGMIPKEDLDVSNYVLIEKLDRGSGTFFIRGGAAPSSESILHASIYREFVDVGAIMHGHSRLFEQYAARLHIPVTATTHPYGTHELAESAVDLLRGGHAFIFLKNHGFVAIGKDIDSVGNVVLDYYGKLVALLKK